MPDQWNAFVVGPRALASDSLDGPLAGLTFAVKDVIDVAGFPTSRGLPRPGPVPQRSASAVSKVLASGALFVGKTATDQLALGLSGQDTASPIPINPARPTALVGGSSSGSAAAVAAGLASFALATDTAGSVRVPASYCGLIGFRPTHGAIDADGVVALAPRFDTVGWLAADGTTAREVGDALLPEQDDLAMPTCLLLLDDVLNELDPAVSGALRRHAALLAVAWDIPVVHDNLYLPLLTVGADFRTRQLADIALHEDLTISDDVLLSAVRQRRASARTVSATDLHRGSPVGLTQLLHRLEDGALLILPAAADAAPEVSTVSTASYEVHRQTTIALNAIAGVLGAPSVVIPSPTESLGTALVAAPGADRKLLDLVARTHPRSTSRALDELRHAFYRYESALLDEDLDQLNSHFGARPHVARFSPEGAAYGRDAILRSRTSRAPGTSRRQIDRLLITLLDESTGVTGVEFTRLPSGIQGFQTQTWHEDAGEWTIQLAHVSLRSTPQPDVPSAPPASPSITPTEGSS